MDKFLTLEDIDDKVKGKIYTQKYQKEEVIAGVKIINVDSHTDEEGDFAEIMRINQSGEIEGIKDFKIAQINRSRLFSGAVKAWHIHFKQDELWYVVSSDHMIVGLWDLRKNSITQNKVMRVVLGGFESGRSQLLYIPKGVAHGSTNIINRPVTMWYFTNQHFDIKNPDEGRISWDALGKDFWKPVRD